MRFKSLPVEVEANQFLHGATAPIGVRTREDGSCYVVTTQGEEVNVSPGDWIILENPPGDGTRAYPCSDEVFRKRYIAMSKPNSCRRCNAGMPSFRVNELCEECFAEESDDFDSEIDDEREEAELLTEPTA